MLTSWVKTLKSWATKRKIYKMGLYQIWKLYTVKEIIIKEKRHVIEWENLIARYLYGKGLASRLYHQKSQQQNITQSRIDKKPE